MPVQSQRNLQSRWNGDRTLKDSYFCRISCDRSVYDWLRSLIASNLRSRSVVIELSTARTSFMGYLLQGRNCCPLGFHYFCEMLTIVSLQERVGWEIFTIVWGNHRGANVDNKEQQTRPELQDWFRFDLLLTVKITGQSLCRSKRGKNFELHRLA